MPGESSPQAAQRTLPLLRASVSIVAQHDLRALAVALALEPHLRLRHVVAGHVADDARRVLVEHVRADARLAQPVGDEVRVVALPRGVEAGSCATAATPLERDDEPSQHVDERRGARGVPRVRRRLVHVAALRHLELQRVHAVVRAAVVPGDPAALEAAVDDVREARRVRQDRRRARACRSGAQLAPLAVPRLRSGRRPAKKRGTSLRSNGRRAAIA